MPLPRKADIEKQIEGRELPFYTTKDAVEFGNGMVAAMRGAAELKQQTQFIGNPGLGNLSQLGTLDLTEMRDIVYGGANVNTNNASADTMPQITEDSRDVSPAQQPVQTQEAEQAIAVGDERQQAKKKDARDIDTQQRDDKQKARGDIEIKDMSKGRDSQGEEKSHEEISGKENEIQKNVDTKDRPSQMKQNTKVQTQQKGRDIPHQEKESQKRQPQKIGKTHTAVKEQQHIQSRTTNVIHKDSDPKIGSEIRQTREMIAHTKSQDKATPERPQDKEMTGMAARLNGARESARAANMMQSIANITQATSRSITVRNGNDMFMTAKEGNQTFAYVNGQKVGAQEAAKFFEKMNAEQGPGKTMQMENMIKQVAHNPAIQTQNIADGLAKAQEARQAEKDGKDRGER